jgi:hypothetical protein
MSIRFIITVFATVVWFSACTKPGSNLQIVVNKDALDIDDKRFSPPYSKKDFHTLIGPPDRSTSKINLIDTWDDLGIHAYSKHGSETYSEFQISFIPDAFEFSPRNPFPGVLSINGQILGAKTTNDELERFRLARTLVPGSSEIYLGALHLFFEQDLDLKKLERVSIDLTMPQQSTPANGSGRSPSP